MDDKLKVDITVKKGDSFPGFFVPRCKINGSIIDMTGGRVVLGFKANPTLRKPDLALTTENGGGLTFTDVTIGAFVVDDLIVDLPVNTYHLEGTYYLPNGKVHTLIEGIFTVTQNIND